MPRVNGVMQLPPGTYGAPGTKIQSAKYNTVIDDFVAEMNSARPITAGGTGATNAADARAALSLYDALLRYDADQVLTGDNLTRARKNLSRILGGWYEHARVPVATGASLFWDLPDDATRWRLTVAGARVGSGSALMTLRCGPTSGAADAGSSDYFTQNIQAISPATTPSSANSDIENAVIAAVLSTGRRLFLIEGHAGNADFPWSMLATNSENDGTSNRLTVRSGSRSSVGRKGRLFVIASAALVAGEFVLEVKS